MWDVCGVYKTVNEWVDNGSEQVEATSNQNEVKKITQLCLRHIHFTDLERPMYDDFFVSSGEFELNGWGFSLAGLFFGLAS